MTKFAQRKSVEIKLPGWQFWKIFSGSSWRRGNAGVTRSEIKQRSVRLLTPLARAPSTIIEARVVALLENNTMMPFDRLVRLVAAGLYHDELRRGAAALDVGLFGRRLFDQEVTGVLEAQDRVLWEVTIEGNEWMKSLPVGIKT
jgi:hypothetical protein